MTVNTPPEDEGRGLRDRLADIPRDRLVDEVVSRWDDMIRLEEVANLRRRVREAELVAQSGGSDGVVIGDLEEIEGRRFENQAAGGSGAEREITEGGGGSRF